MIKLKEETAELLHSGTAIPALPLALNEDRTFDELHERMLLNYYIDSGVGGLAVGVHTTQFNIRDPKVNLYERILRIASEEIEAAGLHRPFIKIAGVCGPTEQAIKEASIAVKYNYDIALLSMGGLNDYSEEELLKRTREIAKIIPVFGFYLQTAAGGRVFSYDFWESFMNIEGVVGVKTAPFNRYQTLDVLRAVCSSPRCEEIAVYTGNDDNIVVDLLTTYEFNVQGKTVKKDIIGGLLGHFAVWTSKAAELMEEVKKAKASKDITALLTKNVQVTDCNGAFFDVRNNFAGCIAGINEVLARQGLLKGNWCLDPEELLGPGQAEEIDRVYREYPELNDDDFVKENLPKWRKTAEEHIKLFQREC
ncbi:MAG: dihydrodipicolinate synthase family protein [Clostridiaceae bacterium]